jgi:GNAT superfamily N-acetyltransferase
MQTLSASDSETAIRPEPGIHIHRACPEEPEDALSLIEEYYEAVDVVTRDDRTALLRYLSDPYSAIWVAYAGSTPIACILYRPLTELDSAGEIKRLYVRPGYRGHGAARLLLHTLEGFARKQGIAWLYLDTKDDLTGAIAFYRRHGYKPCERYNKNPQATIFMRKRLHLPVLVRTFEPGDEGVFRTLNEAWIEKYFQLEEKDRQVLNDPYSFILAPGGQIFMATENGRTVGCCALLPRSDGSWEIAKMAVAEQLRGQGIGRQVLEHVIGYARERSIKRLYIETNSSLANAINLYESVGFRHVSPERIQSSPYARADVFLEMSLDAC